MPARLLDPGMRKEREEFRAFNKQFTWHRTIPAPQKARSVASLLEQGYTLEDIGAMCGVSRERVRQWLFAYPGIFVPTARDIHESKGLRHGAGSWPRRWDPDKGHFVAYNRENQAERQHRLAVKRKAAFRKERTEHLRSIMQGLVDTLGRTPTLSEVAKALGLQSIPGVVAYAGAAFGFSCPYTSHAKEITKKLYRLARLEPRVRGIQGHVNPQKAIKKMREWKRQKRRAT